MNKGTDLNTYVPALLMYLCNLAFTSSYVRKATYPGCVTAKICQFRNKVLHGWNNLKILINIVRCENFIPMKDVEKFLPSENVKLEV